MRARFRKVPVPVKVEVPLPCTTREPVVVDHPETVSPPVCVPLPIVEEPVERRFPDWIRPVAESAVEDA